MGEWRARGLAALMAALAVGCGGRKPAATPEEVFDRGKAAAAADRVRDLLDLFPPEDRQRVVYQVRGAASRLAASKKEGAEECRKDLDEILKGHAVKDVAAPPDGADAAAIAEAAAKALDGVDPARLFEDLVRFWDKHGPPGTALTKQFQGELKDLNVEGDRAAGKVGDLKMVFRKVGDGWYLNPELK